ncbi:tetraspanin-9 isoform X1 [Cloeon dipterum]|uniref:tetraspanin-9 isoform X1 n=1 Tax=Cloeon dipterum TaxID=197152 RepID=UPI00321FD484
MPIRDKFVPGSSTYHFNNYDALEFDEMNSRPAYEAAHRRASEERSHKMGRSGYTCVRHTFCSINVILWLSGCGLLGAGLWLRLAYEGYTALLPQQSVLSADNLLTGIGVAMFVVAFFGCCGAWFQSRCMLVMYFSLVVFLFVLEFLLAAAGFLLRVPLGSYLVDELRLGIYQNYALNPPSSLAILWDHTQYNFGCCGITNHEDWYDTNAWPGQNYVPNSCCLPKFSNMTDCGKSEDPDMWYSKGCAEQVQMFFVQRLHVVGVIGLIVAFIQLFGLISSMLLFCTDRHRRNSYKSYEQA